MNFKETISKLGIEDESTVNALSELFENQQNEITKLQQVKENLFDDKKKWQQQRDEALSEAEKAKNDALKKAGDWETLEANLNASHQSELEKIKEQLAQRDTMILGKANEAAINALAGEFISPDVGKMMLKNMVNTSYSESGEVVTSLNGVDGQLLATDVNSFAEKIRGIDSFASVLKGVDSSGGGGQGSGKSGAQANSYNPAADKSARIKHQEQRLKDAGLI